MKSAMGATEVQEAMEQRTVPEGGGVVSVSEALSRMTILEIKDWLTRK